LAFLNWLAGTLASLFLLRDLRAAQETLSSRKFAISMIVVTPATESTKASLASWWPANLAVFMANVRSSLAQDLPSVRALAGALRAKEPNGVSVAEFSSI
jgi:hypothetical protein